MREIRFDGHTRGTTGGIHANNNASGVKKTKGFLPNFMAEGLKKLQSGRVNNFAQNQTQIAETPNIPLNLPKNCAAQMAQVERTFDSVPYQRVSTQGANERFEPNPNDPQYRYDEEDEPRYTYAEC